MTDHISHFFSAYLTAQLVILPLLLYYLFFDHAKIGHATLRRLRTAVSRWFLILPILFCGLSWFSSNNAAFRAESSIEPTHRVVAAGDRDPIPAEETLASPLPRTPVLQAFSESFSIMDAVFSHLSIWAALAGATGFFLFLFKGLGQIRRLGTIMDQGRVTTSGGVPVYHHHQVREPFSVWLGRNMIFMPEGPNSDDDPAILNHECCHVRRNHTLWAFWENLLVHLFWYNPLIHLLKYRNDLLREVECDLEVSGMVGRRAYIDTMLNHACQNLGHRRFSGSTGWRKTAFRKRIQTLLAEPDQVKSAAVRRSHLAVLGLTLLLSAAAAGCLSTQDDGALIQKINNAYENRVQRHGEAPLSAMPEHLVQIFLLREDQGFYEHRGLDYAATLRAGFNNLLGKPIQGASTITQQLAKGLLYESAPKNLERKLKQIRAAGVLEKHFTKDRIMEMYLNSTYFGEGVYGVSAAAHHYFHLPPGALTLAEISALAVMVSNPAGNSFKKFPQKAGLLQGNLFDRMVAEGILTPEEASKSLEIFQKQHGAL